MVSKDRGLLVFKRKIDYYIIYVNTYTDIDHAANLSENDG